MFIVVTYDVNTEDREGRRRLRRVAKVCQDYGQRVQFSVFECLVSDRDFITLKAALEKEIDPALDSIRIYFLSREDKQKILHFGAKSPRNLEGTLIF